MTHASAGPPAVPLGWQYFWAFVLGTLIGPFALAISIKRFSRGDLGNGFGLLITTLAAWGVAALVVLSLLAS